MSKLEYAKVLSKEVISSIELNYLLQFNSIQQLFTGADKDTFVYKAVSDERKTFFMKIRTGDLKESSVEIPYLLSQYAGPHIIKPIKTIEENLFLKLMDCTVILYPFIDGKTAKETRLTMQQWNKFGEVLRAIHDYKINKNSNEIPLETYDAQWRTKLKKYLNELNNKERDNLCVKQFINLYDQKSELIKFIIYRAEDLLGKMKKARNDYCLCHGDIHAGNILISRDRNFFLTDWDTLIIAPKERDLMFIGGGVGNTWNKKEEEAAFYEGYGGKENVDEEIISYYRFERIIVDLVEYYEQFFVENIEEKNQRAILDRVGSAFHPNGVVDMAFQGTAP